MGKSILYRVVGMTELIYKYVNDDNVLEQFLVVFSRTEILYF